MCPIIIIGTPSYYNRTYYNRFSFIVIISIILPLMNASINADIMYINYQLKASSIEPSRIWIPSMKSKVNYLSWTSYLLDGSILDDLSCIKSKGSKKRKINVFQFKNIRTFIYKIYTLNFNVLIFSNRKTLIFCYTHSEQVNISYLDTCAKRCLLVYICFGALL